MEDKILSLVAEFNNLIKDSITGPDCINPDICDGNCCFIQIKLPKILAKYYIDTNNAEISDFERDDQFSFHIKVNLNTLRCVFFDSTINGCKLHLSGMKVPQCWVYPTGLDVNNINKSCKKYSNWDIKDIEKVSQAEQILAEYIQICLSEAKEENSKKEIITRIDKGLNSPSGFLPPSKIVGVEDNWDTFTFQQTEGFSFSLKSFCDKKKCDNSFLDCDNLCLEVKQEIISLLIEKLAHFIDRNGYFKSYLFNSIFDEKR